MVSKIKFEAEQHRMNRSRYNLIQKITAKKNEIHNETFTRNFGAINNKFYISKYNYYLIKINLKINV